MTKKGRKKCYFWLDPLAADPPSEFDVLNHDGNTLRMQGAEIGILKETHKIALGCFLKGSNRGRLKSNTNLYVLSDLSDEPSKRNLPNQ